MNILNNPYEAITDRINRALVAHMLERYIWHREFVRIDLAAQYLKERRL